MRNTAGRFVVGLAAILGAWFLVNPADAAPTPYERLAMPANDGGIVICPPPQFASVSVVSGEKDQRTALIQVREGEGAVRLGSSRVRGLSTTKNGAQLKSRESVSWNVGYGGPAYCVAEANSDAGVILDVVYGVGGPR